MKACSFPEHAFFLDPLRLRFVTEAAQEGPADMTRKLSFILLAGLAVLAACDQSGVGGGPAGDLDANAAAPAAAEDSAEAQSDPANTLENQAAALSGAGETGNATGDEGAAGNDAQANAQAGAEANSQ